MGEAKDKVGQYWCLNRSVVGPHRWVLMVRTSRSNDDLVTVYRGTRHDCERIAKAYQNIGVAEFRPDDPLHA
jgi:hypothetical protein